MGYSFLMRIRADRGQVDTRSAPVIIARFHGCRRFPMVIGDASLG
jgi:hypothetical protein